MSVKKIKLNRGGGIKYGIPYQGSKSKIIDSIYRMFPNADNFYDLFGGGFSVTHFMLENRSISYKQFHFNEIRTGISELIKDSIDGKYSYRNFKPEWISRERFNLEKDNNAYIKIVWSFGNNGRTYLFGKDIENQKRSMHQAVVFGEFDEFMKQTFKIEKWPSNLTITGRRIYLKKLCNNRIELQQLEQLERLQRLQQLERLQQLQQLERLERLDRLYNKIVFTNIDYRKVLIKPNSVIYCDIPYKGTADYENAFNHDEFFNWANNQNNPVFISEYNVDDDRFYLLKEIYHRSTFSSGGDKSIPVTEKLYGNKVAYEIIKSYLNK